MANKKYAEVVVDIPLKKIFHYNIPPSLSNQIEVGKRVKVPFGHRKVIGYCVGLTDETTVKSLKDIIQVVDARPIIDATLLKVAKWIANFYFCGWGESLQAFLPAVVRRGLNEKTIKVVRLSKDASAINEAVSSLIKKAPKQAEILKVLAGVNKISVQELCDVSNCSAGSIKGLQEKGLVTIEDKPVDLTIVEGKQPHKSGHLRPTEEQEKAINFVKVRLRQRKYSTLLLKGVTGSGKTEVYLQAISEALELGMKAIVLVPEISLTPQTIERFKSRFNRVAVLHSSLTERSRSDQWWDIRNGNADIVIGARSAVFAPLKNLGLIIIDEEHENTFKQESSPRYNARTVSVVRAKYSNALVILGTATPSLESYYNAHVGNYEFINLPSRIGNKPLPIVEIIDMRHEKFSSKKPSHITRYLEHRMNKSLERREQVILFLNRRGFSSFINCKRCGFVLKCKNCDISMTYHKHKNSVICHYCFAEGGAPDSCPECGNSGIKFLGFGTERIEEEIRIKFPDYRLLRMDGDTMRGKDAHEKAFRAFKNGEVDILLGTQMIAKGLDFPNVTLVGVLSADTIINLPDFRASERTFQLMAQVAGRTGRGDKEGIVIIQTYNPKHYSILHATTHDYEGFAKKELEYRKQLYYPPYARLVRIVFHGAREEDVREVSVRISDKLKKHMNTVPGMGRSVKEGGVEILGPAPAPITKLKDKYRWHIILKSKSIKDLQLVLNNIEDVKKKSKKVQTIIDVDPYMLL